MISSKSIRTTTMDILSNALSCGTILIGLGFTSIPTTMVQFFLPCLRAVVDNIIVGQQHEQAPESLSLLFSSSSSSTAVTMELSELEIFLSRLVGGLLITLGLTNGFVMRSFHPSDSKTWSAAGEDSDNEDSSNAGTRRGGNIRGDSEEGTTTDDCMGHRKRVLISQSILGLCLFLIGFMRSSSPPSSSSKVVEEEMTIDDGGGGAQGQLGSCESDSIATLSVILVGAVCFIVACVGLMMSCWPASVGDVSMDDYVGVSDDDGGGYSASGRRPNVPTRGFRGWGGSVLCCYRGRGEGEGSAGDSAVSTAPLLSGDIGTLPDECNEEDIEARHSQQQQQQQQQELQNIQENPSPAATANEHNQDNPEFTSRITGTRRLIKLAGPHSRYLYIGCIVLLIRLPFSLSIPHFVSTTLGSLATLDYHSAQINILYLLVCGTIDAALDFWCIYLFDTANLDIVKGVRLDTFAAIVRQDMAFFDVTKTGDLASRLNSDCGEMGSDLTWFFRFSIESVVRITGIVSYMVIRCPRLGLTAISVVPLVAVVNKAYGDWLHRNAVEVQDALAEANSVAQEAFACVRTVIAFAAEEVEKRRYRAGIEKHYRLNVRQIYARGVYYMLISTFLINTCVQALLLYVGTVLVREGTLGVDVLLAFMLYQGQLQNEVLNLFNSFTSLIKSSGAGEKVFRLLDRVTPPPGTGSHLVRVDQTNVDGDNYGIDDGGIDDERPQPTRKCEAIFHNVHFSYPSRPAETVLKQLELTIPSSQTIAIVGKSGCGKSTIVNLIQRLYDPTEGHITIDGFDLKDLDVRAHRRRIGIVTQDPVLFAGTIRSNILYGSRGGSSGAEGETNVDEEIDTDMSTRAVITAAKLANAHGFIENFPNGYDTETGERGVQLSGGQKQRIAIARAIIGKPELLLLDEATSALDSESEKLVQEALDNLLSGPTNDMTTVIIAHRLQTVRNADRIVVIDGGEVYEEGTHTELMSNVDGMYRKMIDRAEATESGILPED